MHKKCGLGSKTLPLAVLLCSYTGLTRGYDVQETNHSFQNVCGGGLAKVNSDATDAQGLAWSVLFHPGLPRQALAFFRGFPTLEDARGNLARVRVLLG